MSAATAHIAANAVIVDLLLAMLECSVFVNALRRNGKPCRIPLPEEAGACRSLVDAHLYGKPMTLTFLAEGREPWTERVDAVVLAAYCPRADGLCQYLVIDLDAADHGSSGLADPVHAARVIAERADNAGLSSGLLVVRSRRGRGRHVFLVPSAPVPLEEAVLVIAALAASAWLVAARDVVDYESQHAFRQVDGGVAKPGDAGSFELIPRSSGQPQYGWPITLPAAGAFAHCGGGVIVDPFTDNPFGLHEVPRCDPEAWSRFVVDARNQRAMHTLLHQRSDPVRPKMALHHDRDHFERIDWRTRDFLEGRVPEGSRNNAAFAASANLLGCGVSERETRRLVLAGARACGLPEREALASLKSAVASIQRKGGHQ